MEVMGLMLGEFVDPYTVNCVDVFAMPQSGSSVSVEAVDPVYQQEMLEMLKQTGRPEQVVGWYHSHPGFGCWLSSTDTNTQQSFQQLHPRCVAVVVDPIQSVKGKVVIDAFRNINPQVAMMGLEPRQTTAHTGHLVKPSIQALIHGLNRAYYSISISYRKNELEEKVRSGVVCARECVRVGVEGVGGRCYSRALPSCVWNLCACRFSANQMLMNLHKRKWTAGLSLPDFAEHSKVNAASLESLRDLTALYA
jgi:26S proteasome regulatory subunit N11